MRIPISHALGWPERIESGAGSLDLMAVGNLQFEAPDLVRYPCLALARHAWQAGGTASAILNAANEMAVQAFLDQLIPFTAIHQVIEQTLEQCSVHEAASLEVILEDDASARTVAADCIRADRGVAVR
jgi:1-deoxy-D-xylulose-5-phosphate reductoisomerase